MIRRLSLLALLLVAPACRGEQVGSSSETARLAHLVDSLAPSVEKAVGLKFRTRPQSAVRSRADVRRYLAAKLTEELTPERARGIEAAYRLFGMLPDTTDLRALLLDLLTEQVVGYYDADSVKFFGVEGAPPDQLGITVAHEMVHALQGQYLPLDSLLETRGDNDRTTAAQAILEGQAVLASIQVMAPTHDVLHDDEVWNLLEQQTQDAQNTMPQFGAAPLVVREGLIFPYVQGALFMRWWETKSGQQDTVPFGPRMPASSEEIMHPARYAAGDAPLKVRIDSTAGDSTLHEDSLGELETAILEAQLNGQTRVSFDTAVGWGGDRYRVLQTPGGPALVWYLVFDDVASATRFRSVSGPKLAAMRRTGYRADFAALEVSGRPAVRFVMAPVGWAGWDAIPVAAARQP